MMSGLRSGVKRIPKILGLIMLCLKKGWRRFASSSFILWLLGAVLVIGVLVISYGWNLKTEQTIGALVAALVVPLAFISQRAVLREDQRQKMRYEAYVNIVLRIETIESELASISVAKLRSNIIIHDAQSVRIALKDFTNTYHSHEMVFMASHLSFKYLHFSLMKLTKILEEAERGISRNGYGDEMHSSEAEARHEKCKVYSNDIASYFFDLKKDLIESLGFARLNGSYVEERKPLDRKYKLLREVATRHAVKKLEEAVLNKSKA